MMTPSSPLWNEFLKRNGIDRICIIALYREGRIRPAGYAITERTETGGYFAAGIAPKAYRTRTAAKRAAIATYGDVLPIVNVYNVC